MHIMQLALPGLAFPSPDASRYKHRLFYAVLPPKGVALRISHLIETLRSEHELYGTAFDSNRLHISLLGLGDYVEFPRHLVRWIQTQTAACQFEQFVVNFDRVSSLGMRSRQPRRYPLALRDSTGGHGLKNLQRAIAALFEVERLPSFTPHLTLSYDEQHVAEETVNPINWLAAEFVLIHSKINREKLQPYSLLDGWQLR
jgi:RNA 2',3'-cyclic 3'-phosphodiesterase